MFIVLWLITQKVISRLVAPLDNSTSRLARIMKYTYIYRGCTVYNNSLKALSCKFLKSVTFENRLKLVMYRGWVVRIGCSFRFRWIWLISIIRTWNFNFQQFCDKCARIPPSHIVWNTVVPPNSRDYQFPNFLIREKNMWPSLLIPNSWFFPGTN